MKKEITVFCISTVLFCAFLAQGDIINGSFTGGLSGWTANEGVVPGEDEFIDTALLLPNEDEIYSSILAQRFQLDPGMNRLSFSFLAVLEDPDGGEIETDHFYASLLDSTYLYNPANPDSVVLDETDITLIPSSQSIVNMDNGDPAFFEWDSDGTTSEADSVTVSEPDADDWRTVSLLLPDGLTGEFLTIRFELFHDYDLFDPVTTLFIDDVILSQTDIPPVVPAPGAILLAAIGAVITIRSQRRKR